MANKEQVRSDIAFVKEQIEEILSQKSPAAHENAARIMDMEYVRAFAQWDNEIAILQTMTGIYRAEHGEGIAPTVFDLAGSIEDVLAIYYKLTFYLQRIWFEVEEQAQAEMVEYVTKRGLSPYAIFMVLQSSRITDKDLVWKKVMKLWEKADER